MAGGERTLEEALRFEVDCSFDPRFIARLVHFGAESERYYLRCTLDRYADDGSWEIPVSRDVALELLSDLAAISLAPVPEYAMGLDGTTYRLAIGRGWNEIVLRWWGRVPSQWQPIVPVLRRLVGLAGPRAADVQVE